MTFQQGLPHAQFCAVWSPSAWTGVQVTIYPTPWKAPPSKAVSSPPTLCK